LIFNFYLYIFFSTNILINTFTDIKNIFKYYFFFKKRIGCSVWRINSSWNYFYFYFCFFFFIIFSNFIGLIPYIFTSTSHLSITILLALPIWLGTIFYSIIFQYNNLLAHLVPLGTPSFLIPIIVIIETVSNIIRPITLSIRLAANIVAGHLLLTLLGSQGPIISMIILIVLIIRLILLLMLEVAVACIQSYVFTILRSLYLNELIRVSFNKKVLK